MARSSKKIIIFLSLLLWASPSHQSWWRFGKKTQEKSAKTQKSSVQIPPKIFNFNPFDDPVVAIPKMENHNSAEDTLKFVTSILQVMFPILNSSFDGKVVR